ncbi:SLBB domain-containing protein [Pseudoalteromonas rubra]|uniref:Polysaccharide biosynthesis protein n=1 Tax=Pseudoalteromonas rubra TaxID=43658 RepID=A0A4Q7EDJ2_9GAMM|nr:SLBB domain-containing protein [Pseudoalteromonas rubra]RZM81156.1 polysaccharide biosynthesis protein [Pseudoalteromonas rubra]
MLFRRIFALIVLSYSVCSLAFTPSAEQIEQFKKLPKAQQEALAKQYGIDLSSLDLETDDSELSTQSNQKTVLPRNEKTDELVSEEERLKPVVEELKPFGYELFAGEPTTFMPTEKVSVPSDYIIGLGDRLLVTLYGKESASYELEVDNEGRLTIPKFSPVQVAGLTYAEVKKLVKMKVEKEAIGIQAFVAIGKLQTMRILVVGEAYKPGSYALSPLSTVTHAIFSSGGLSDIASLRNIQVKRRGKVVTELDLYDLLLKGDSSNDINLQSGDVVFIPSVGPQLKVEGLVKRPGIFELKEDDTVEDLINMFGGFDENAYLSKVQVTRIHKGEKSVAVSVDFTAPELSYQPQGGDHLKVQKVNSIVQNSVTLIGAVARPGNYQWYDGFTLRALINDVKSDLLPQADLSYGLVVREKSKLGNIEVIQFSISDIILNDDLTLQQGDKIYVFSRFEEESDEALALRDMALTVEQKKLQEKVKLWHEYEYKQFEDKVTSLDETFPDLTSFEIPEELVEEEEVEYAMFSRHTLLEPILEQIQYQASNDEPLAVYEIKGEVKYPGIYPLNADASLSDALSAAGGLLESAHETRAGVTRFAEQVGLDYIDVNLTSERHSFALQSKDTLHILKKPNWLNTYTVHLEGEVKFPGTYTVKRGETLQNLLVRAGGLTEYAQASAAIFTRESIRELEKAQFKKLSQELRKEIAAMSFQKSVGVNTSMSYTDMNSLLKDLSRIRAVGRLVIDLQNIKQGKENLILQDGDKLIVPGKQDSVSIIGEVNYASSHLFKPNLDINDYLALSGGTKARADEDRIYVIKSNGAVFVPQSSGWFAVNSQNKLSPGDTIVVPLDSSHMDNLTLWSTTTQILYQAGVALAAISSL